MDGCAFKIISKTFTNLFPEYHILSLANLTVMRGNGNLVFVVVNSKNVVFFMVKNRWVRYGCVRYDGTPKNRCVRYGCVRYDGTPSQIWSVV